MFTHYPTGPRSLIGVPMMTKEQRNQQNAHARLLIQMQEARERAMRLSESEIGETLAYFN
ncbi:MAG: hypothetical protein ABL890_02240 [Candidatus Peribacteraceae bacterium]